MTTHGNRLRALREDRLLTIKAIVEAMEDGGHGMSFQQFYRIERGQWPTERQLITVCKFFKVTSEWFLFGVDDGLLNKLTKEDRAVVEGLIHHLVSTRPPLNRF